MFSTKIRDMRLQVGLSQEKMAKELNVSISTISRWENGWNLPDENSMKLIKSCCKKYNWSYEDLKNEWTKPSNNEVNNFRLEVRWKHKEDKEWNSVFKRASEFESFYAQLISEGWKEDEMKIVIDDSD